jgi:multiple sugar transport system permease protein
MSEVPMQPRGGVPIQQTSAAAPARYQDGRAGVPGTRKRTASIRVTRAAQRTAIYLALIVASIAFLFPLFWMVSTSLKAKEQVMAVPPQLIPNPIEWSNYPEAMTAPDFNFPVLLKNTMAYAVIETFGIVISCVLVAYSFARMRWPGRDFFFILTLASMMIPGTVTLVPVFIFFKEIGWYGSMAPLIVPGFFGSAFNIFLLRQFFMTIPIELTEAARVDGASHWRILWQIVVPLATPAIATITLFEFLYCWTDFMGPLIYLSKESLYTLSLGLYAFRGRWEIRYDLMMAAAMVVTLPILILFFMAQRTFIEGIALTGVKG